MSANMTAASCLRWSPGIDTSWSELFGEPGESGGPSFRAMVPNLAHRRKVWNG